MGKITEMTLAGPVDGSEMIEVVQNGTSKKAPLSALSAAGKSAYKSAMDAGFVGTEAAWVASLKGAKGDTGAAGTAGAKGNDGADGLSAYELAVAAGYIGNADAWLASLKGIKGDTGGKGDPGDAGVAGATTLILGTKVDVDALPDVTSVPEGTSYIVGEDLYTNVSGVWTNVGQIRGDRGYSAYELAINSGDFVGTYEDWYASLKGSDGIGLRILGSYPSVGDLPATGNLAGDCWIIDEAMYVWDLTAWVKVGQVGPTGKSAYELAVAGGFVGNVTQWLQSLPGKSVYDLAVLDGFTGTVNDFLISLRGKDTYQLAVDDGFVGNLSAWLQSLRGKDGASIRILGTLADLGALPLPANSVAGDSWIIGDNLHTLTNGAWLDVGTVRGIQGFSAYDLAINSGKFTGTFDEWYASLKGSEGTGLRILGSYPDISLLPASNNQTGDCWIINEAMYVWDSAAWVKVGQVGPSGKSAYELAVAGGYVGTLPNWLLSLNGKDNFQLAKDSGFAGNLDDWLASLVGPRGQQGIQGIQGEKGDPANAVTILGTYANSSELPPTGNVSGDAYYIGSNLWVWATSGEWVDVGQINGLSAYQLAVTENGFVGTLSDWLISIRGMSNYEVAVATGFVGTAEEWLLTITGPRGPQGIQGDSITGPQGPAGKNLVIAGKLANVGQLPDPLTTDPYVAYIVGQNLYLLIAQVWVDCGSYVGPQGPQGIQGDRGLTGATGAGLVIKGSVLSADVLPATGQVVGDAWLIDTGDLYIWTGATWWNAGPLRGPAGKSAYDVAVDLGFGDTRAKWLESLVGPQGLMGPGISILGRLTDTSGLPGTGNLGEGYMIGTHFWGWTGAAYEDLGVIQGPQGIQGIPGPQGIQGPIGLKGNRGSLWLHDVRDPNLVDGSPQDYWVNSTTNEYFFKNSTISWISLGHLGGGNVFSPSQDGKLYAREYDQWVEITLVEPPTDGVLYGRKNGAWAKVDVLEAPNDGKLYGREGQGWVEVVVGEAPKDGKQYIRKDGGWLEVVIPPAGLAEAPTDGGYYTRKNGAWVAVPVAEAPSDGKQYVRKNGAWVEVVIPAGLADAPNDAKTYGRGGNAWVPVVPEAPADGKAYGRKGSTWSLVLEDAPNDANYYTRHGGAWAIAPAGLGDAPADGSFYSRKNGAWSVINPGLGDAPADGAQYVRKNNAWTSFDRYDLKLNAAAAGVLDLAIGNVFTVANASATTISFKAGTVPGSTRTMTVVLVINGNATITWPTISWNGGAAPVLGTTSTVVTLMWDGTRWIGNAGASI